MYYSHSFQDPETGQLVDVVVDEVDDFDDFDDVDEFRNATRDHRTSGRSRSRSSGGRRFIRPPRGPSSQSPRSAGSGMVPRARTSVPQTRTHDSGVGERPRVVRPYHPLPSGPFLPMGPLGFEQAGYFAIKKDAIAEIIPSLGQVWASFLGRPEPPTAVGDDAIDRDNAALHRDALADHQQNQTRILALTDLAARAVKLFAS